MLTIDGPVTVILPNGVLLGTRPFMLTSMKTKLFGGAAQVSGVFAPILPLTRMCLD
jgi:hypothetical protein